MTVIKRVLYDTDDEYTTVHARPNRMIVRKDFKNGNKYTLEFTRLRIKGYKGGSPCFQWHLCIYVGEPKQADKFRRGNVKPRITGNGEPKCLFSIGRQVEWFVGRMGMNEELVIRWADERRHKVYRRILRNKAFIEEEHAIIARNPEYWQWD